MEKNFDAIVAGAGIWGCTVARRLAEAGKKVLVLEKRAAVGGNCRCEIDPETGIEVHTYGSHIFHTGNEEVWKFVRRFTDFNGYRHCVLAKTKKVGGESRLAAAGVDRRRRAETKYSEKDPPPMYRPLTEAFETVVKHQAAGFSPSTTGEGAANSTDARKGGGAKNEKGEVCSEKLGTAEGFHLYHLPIGKTLLEEFFGVSMRDKNLREFLAEPVDTESSPRQKEDGDGLWERGGDTVSPVASRTYGDAVFDAFIRGYTSKQWGVAPEKVDPSIIARLKVRDNYSTDYFDDPYQGIPSEGYNRMFERMLEHPNITVQCSCELVLEKVSLSRESGATTEYLMKVKGEGEEEINKFLCSPAFSTSSLCIYYSGPLDALFNYKFGALPWRTLRFERETVPIADYQGNSVVNYTDDSVPYTRVHEFKHYHPEPVGPLSQAESLKSGKKTVIMREYSAAWQPGDEPYYPIDNEESRVLLAKYREEVEKLNGSRVESECGSGSAGGHSRTRTFNSNAIRLIIGGRLGGYKYFDMDKSIAAALAVELP